VPIVIEKARLVGRPTAPSCGWPQGSPRRRPAAHAAGGRGAARPCRSKRLVQIIRWPWSPRLHAMNSFEFAVALLSISSSTSTARRRDEGVRRTVRGIFIFGFILPGFGAAAVADDEAASRWREFIIAAMGPAFGIAVTVATLVAYVVTGGRYQVLGQACLWYACINVFTCCRWGSSTAGGSWAASPTRRTRPWAPSPRSRRGALRRGGRAPSVVAPGPRRLLRLGRFSECEEDGAGQPGVPARPNHAVLIRFFLNHGFPRQSQLQRSDAAIRLNRFVLITLRMA